MANAEKTLLQRSKFNQPHLLKASFLFSLLVVLFLLISFVFMTPENVALANMIQKINVFFSWPNTLLETVIPFTMHWGVTAIGILLFWFLAAYLLLIFITCLSAD